MVAMVAFGILMGTAIISLALLDLKSACMHLTYYFLGLSHLTKNNNIGAF